MKQKKQKKLNPVAGSTQPVADCTTPNLRAFLRTQQSRLCYDLPLRNPRHPPVSNDSSAAMVDVVENTAAKLNSIKMEFVLYDADLQALIDDCIADCQWLLKIHGRYKRNARIED